ncbi:hypothetical protein PhCBS80983_g06433, partial [Powellomyces hirtus]
MVEATENGTATIQAALPNGRTTTCHFKDVWLVPKLERSLLSVAQLEGAGANIQIVGGRCEIRTSKGALALSCNRQEALYALGQPLDAAAQCHAVAISTSAATLETWQRCPEHLNHQSIQLMARKGLVQGMEAVRVLETTPCSTCALGKATKLPFPKERTSRASEVLELVHSDVCGPMRTLTIGRARYFVLFIDDKSSPICSRQRQRHFPGSRSLLQRQQQRQYAHSRSLSLTMQNGVAECMNRTLVEMAPCLLLQAGLPYKFWDEALMTAACLRNRSPTGALHNKATPWQIWTGTRPNIQHLRIFGCTAYASILKKNQHKLGLNATRCISLGYGQDVRFDEESLAGVPGKPDHAAQAPTDMADELSDAENDFSQQGQAPEDASDQGDKLDGGSEQGEDFEDAQEHQPSPVGAIPSVLRKPKASKSGTGLLAEAFATREDEPASLKAALKAPDAKQWEQAAQTKLNSLHANHTWDLVPLPAGHQPIKCKW